MTDNPYMRRRNQYGGGQQGGGQLANQYGGGQATPAAGGMAPQWGQGGGQQGGQFGGIPQTGFAQPQWGGQQGGQQGSRVLPPYNPEGWVSGGGQQLDQFGFQRPDQPPPIPNFQDRLQQLLGRRGGGSQGGQGGPRNTPTSPLRPGYQWTIGWNGEWQQVPIGTVS
jgi:hypothetical protein